METVECEVIDLAQELQVFEPLAAKIAEVKEKNASLVFDYEDKEGNKNARSHIAQLRRLKSPITETHRMAKAEALKFTKALDAKKSELIGAVDEMISVHHTPIWEIEQREAVIEAEKQLKIQQAKEAEEEQARLELEAREQAVREEREALEKEKAEIERKAREAQLILKAKADAEHVAKQALADAENRRIADVQRVKDEATARAAELSAHIAHLGATERALKEEADRKEQERQADANHRSEIHRAIYKAILAVESTAVYGNQAQAITQRIIDNKIPHVEIKY